MSGDFIYRQHVNAHRTIVCTDRVDGIFMASQLSTGLWKALALRAVELSWRAACASGASARTCRGADSGLTCSSAEGGSRGVRGRGGGVVRTGTSATADRVEHNEDWPQFLKKTVAMVR